MTKTKARTTRTNSKKHEETKKVNGQMDFTLLVVVLALLGLGIIMVLSASSPSALASTGSSYTYAIKQMQFAAIGIFLMIVISRIDYRKFNKLYRMAYWGSIVALLLVVTPLGYGAGGARRWIDLGFTTMQPSEIAKIGLIIFFAGYLSKHKDDIKSFVPGFVKPIVWLVPVVLILVLIQNHLSATIIIVVVTAVMMILAGTKIRDFMSVGMPIGAAGVAALLYMAQKTGEGAFRLNRIVSFLDPWQDAQGDGWQVIQGLYAIGSGGFFGVGLGQSKQKYLYISQPQNDFIFAVLAEELGFIGCAIVIILFAIFIWRGILIAIKAPDTFGSLVAVGITVLIGLQAIMNIAVVTSSMPVTGISLPFFSYGGTSLVILLCSVGVLLNISRHSTKL